MRQPAYLGQLKRDVKQSQKRRKDIAGYLDHPLKGGWKGFRDAHIEPDWLLIYKIAGDVVRFERKGRHTDLFNE